MFYVATGAKTVFQFTKCKICERYDVISLESYYHCLECGWKIHFECAKVPQAVGKKNPHIHPLVCKIFLAEDDSLEYCGVCETMVHIGHHVYSCKECDFLGHIECILRWEVPSPLYLKDLFSSVPIRETNRQDCENQLMVNDIGHIHMLRWIRVGSYSCQICKEKISTSSSSWRCETCSFEAHDSCAKLGKPSRHRLHLDHDLTLLPNYPAGYVMNCNSCKEEILGFNLFCRICNLITCMKCVVKYNHVLGLLHRGQKVIGTTRVTCREGRHDDLFQVMVSTSYLIPCTICDEKLCGKVVSCMECAEIYHSHCIDILRQEQLNHPIHPDHELRLELQRGSNKCIVCKLDITRYGRFCYRCDVGFHIKCSKDVDGLGKKNCHKHTFYNFWIDEDSSVTRACSVCGRPCGVSFYGCIDCNFSAHVECIGFPANVKSQRHQHTVVAENSNMRLGICEICSSVFSESVLYECTQCHALFDKECIMSKDAREAATEEEQLGDIYFMYVERLLLNVFKKEKEDEENLRLLTLEESDTEECNWWYLG